MSFKGKLNLYVCEDCGRGYITIDRDEGVTPFLNRCKFGRRDSLKPGDIPCRGMAVSRCYPKDLTGEPEFEWYRATEDQARAIEGAFPGSMQHHRQGGLFFRRIQPVASQA